MIYAKKRIPSHAFVIAFASMAQQEIITMCRKRIAKRLQISIGLRDVLFCVNLLNR
jgi:hypothetical protein